MTSRTEERRAASSGARGTSKGMCLWARVRLARTMRWAMVGSGCEEGAGDLVGGEAAEETEGEGGAGLGGEDGMAGDEDEAEEVVADGGVESGVEVGRGLFEGFNFAGELFVFALGDGVAAEQIDGAGRLAVAVSLAVGFSGTPD